MKDGGLITMEDVHENWVLDFRVSGPYLAQCWSMGLQDAYT